MTCKVMIIIMIVKVIKTVVESGDYLAVSYMALRIHWQFTKLKLINEYLNPCVLTRGVG